jgi:hypothetical protein
VSRRRHRRRPLSASASRHPSRRRPSSVRPSTSVRRRRPSSVRPSTSIRRRRPSSVRPSRRPSRRRRRRPLTVRTVVRPVVVVRPLSDRPVVRLNITYKQHRSVNPHCFQEREQTRHRHI